jgi:hypothetical protein
MSASDMRDRNKEVPDVAALIRATVLFVSRARCGVLPAIEASSGTPLR